MRKLLLLLALFFIISPLLLNAQNQPSPEYFKNLFIKNASGIGITTNDLENWRISDAHLDKSSNVIFIYLQQTYLGIDIDKAVNSLSFKNEKFITGNLEQLKNLKPLNKITAPSIDVKTALFAAAGNINTTIKTIAIPLRTIAESHTYIFDKLGISYNEIPVKLVWLRDDNNNLQLVWQATISSDENNALWQISVDASTGRVINKTNLTVYEQGFKKLKKPHQIIVLDDEDQDFADNSVTDLKTINSSKYNVIAYPNESPLYVNPFLETNPWTRNNDQDANTLKWNNDGNDYKTLRGNNVFVQQDLDSNNNTSGFSASSSTNAPDLNFNFSFDNTADPTVSPTASFNETNLFYWDNLMHDMSYQYGFNEVAGNFQASNLSRNGKGGDYVLADAQDGGGKGTRIDNANMSTPVDGFSPRQQMYLWYGTPLKGFYINSPNSIKGEQFNQEGSVSDKNKLAQKGPVTSDIIIYKNSSHPDSSNGCDAASNASALNGKIAYVDRGNCNFVTKFHNAQSAGAKALIVGNVSANDPRYPNDGGNVLINMGGDDNTITIPGVFTIYNVAREIKILGSNKVNATLSNSPLIDGELDNTIPTHEYTHGISNRLIGGPQNVSCLQNNEQMGEGWSDWYALMMTQDWAKASASGNHIRFIGTYAAGFDTVYIGGIRTYPYSTSFNYNPWTYDSLKKIKPIQGSPDEHTIGEIWTVMLWDMTWNLIKDYGISQNIFNAAGTGGNIIALKLVTQGLKLTKCSPGFVDARNGILDADTALFGGKYSKEIWAAFAKRGLGYSAKEGSSNNNNDGEPAYDLPSTVLPVTFGTFTAQKQNTTSLLKWTTEQESNTDKFIVERSGDGKTYTSIGEVKAAGNGILETAYQLSDQHPLNGNNIYRIKEMDKEGRFNLSDLRSLNFADIKPYIQISPNPANNIVTIKIPGNMQNLTVRLLSTNGQLIFNKVLDGETLTLDVSKLAAGVYNIVVDGKGYSAKYKIIIQ
jgi:extracellular elastinolytic metalloproteinase